MVMICDAVDIMLHPDAVAVIIEVPFHSAFHVTIPVDEFIVLPPVTLATSRLYVIVVAFVAVAV